MKKPKSILWIIDPWETLDHPRDTTLRWMEALLPLGVTQYACNVRSIRYENHRIKLDAQKVLDIQPVRDSQSFEWGMRKPFEISFFDQVHYRTDPPVDLAYLHPLQLLALGASHNQEFVNPLSVLLSANEKMEAAQLKRLMPPTLLSSQRDPLLAWGRKMGRAVLKPLHAAQSIGIELLDFGNREGIRVAQQKLTEATHHFTVPVVLQAYLEGILEGEKRLWFLDGKLFAWIKKLPLSGDFRVNLDRGSQLAPTSLTSAELKKAELISKHLKARKIRLAAVDLIDGFLTDFNFTSPGLIPQMERILEQNLASPMVRQLLK